jgi:hypothetical protein
MRYTKLALLIFGAGLLLGLAVVVAEIDALARVASLSMALGIIAVPVGAIIDWRRAMRRPAGPARGRRQPVRGRVPPNAGHLGRRKGSAPKR